MTPEKLLTVEEVAELFGIPEATIYSQRYRGEMPGTLGFKVGKWVRFDPKDIEAWIDKQRAERPQPRVIEAQAPKPAPYEPAALPGNPAEWLARLGRDADDDA